MAPPELVTTWFGVFLLEDGQVTEQRLFPTEAEAIAHRLSALHAGEILDEEAELAGTVETVTVPGRRLLPLEGASIGPVPPHQVTPEDHGFDLALKKQAAVAFTRATIREALAEEPRHLMQAVSYLDESHEVENLLGERLVAWMTLHTPEVVYQVEDHGELARLVVEHEDVEAIREAAGVTESLGAPLADKEAKAARGLAQALLDHQRARSSVESFITEVTREMAPNLSTLVGPTIAARLIHQAGGLMELARMPASTVQTLGAEKALFRHFTEGAPPPKHGVIFQHPLIHRGHPKDRGSIARAMAGKAAIAARCDAYGDKEIGAELKAEVQARADEVSRIGRRKAIAKHDKGKGGR